MSAPFSSGNFFSFFLRSNYATDENYTHDAKMVNYDYEKVYTKSTIVQN